MSRREQLSGLAEVSKYVLFLAGLHTSKKQDIHEHLCQGAARQSISVDTAMLCRLHITELAMLLYSYLLLVAFSLLRVIRCNSDAVGAV